MKTFLSNIWYWIIQAGCVVIIFLCIATPMYLIIGALFFGEPGKTETIILNTEKCGIVFTTRCDISHATCKIFPAFVAMRNASSFTSPYGLTRISLEIPIFFMARAVDPILPGASVPTKTMRMLSSSFFIGY